MRIKRKGFFPRLWRFLKRVFLFFFILHLLYIVALKWVDPPITITQFSNWISGYGMKRDYVAYNEISPNMKLAVIASEDQLFAHHAGFDWKNIQKAREHNEKQPNRIRGASTISQQVAKNVFLWQGRSWIRKGAEAYFTKMIEWIWGKQRILEVYLNVIEMGEGLFGVEAAANTYFEKPASQLNKKEAAMIAAILPNPKRYSITSTYVTKRQKWITTQMKNLEANDAIREIVNAN